MQPCSRAQYRSGGQGHADRVPCPVGAVTSLFTVGVPGAAYGDSLGQAMSRNGQPEVTDFPFPTTPGRPPGVAVTDVPGLAGQVRRLGIDTGAPVRTGFHLLVTVRSGTLSCAVDTTDCQVGEGCWLWVRPGQVFRLGHGEPYAGATAATDATDATTATDATDARQPSMTETSLTGLTGPSAAGPAAVAAPPTTGPSTPQPSPTTATVILFQASVLGAATVTGARLDRRAWRLPLAPAPEARAPLEQTLALLESEYHRLRDLPLEAHVEVVRHLLAVLVLRLSHLPGGHRRPAAGDETFRRFRAAVEEDFAHRHRVEDYAARLGYSVRSLTRACNAAVGRGAKAVIDDRLVLEAKRLLLHTALPAGAIGDRLGFTSTTVFARFFRHRTGETPTGFRHRAQAHEQPRPSPATDEG